MRVNLEVPFSEKDQAKSLGARWDMARKIWYLEDPRSLSPFLRWLPKGLLAVPKARPPKKKEKRAKAAFQPRMTSSAPAFDCGCDHIPPWEDCEHSADISIGEEESAHIRSILKGL
jgi:hypothetical protein